MTAVIALYLLSACTSDAVDPSGIGTSTATSTASVNSSGTTPTSSSASGSGLYTPKEPGASAVPAPYQFNVNITSSDGTAIAATVFVPKLPEGSADQSADNHGQWGGVSGMSAVTISDSSAVNLCWT